MGLFLFAGVVKLVSVFAAVTQEGRLITVYCLAAGKIFLLLIIILLFESTFLLAPKLSIELRGDFRVHKECVIKLIRHIA